MKGKKFCKFCGEEMQEVPHPEGLFDTKTGKKIYLPVCKNPQCRLNKPKQHHVHNNSLFRSCSICREPSKIEKFQIMWFGGH